MRSAIREEFRGIVKGVQGIPVAGQIVIVKRALKMHRKIRESTFSINPFP